MNASMIRSKGLFGDGDGIREHDEEVGEALDGDGVGERLPCCRGCEEGAEVGGGIEVGELVLCGLAGNL